jgi:hypothetical protein
MATYSVSPAGERFPLPTPADDAREIARIETLVAHARADGKEIVVVMGVGFVGAVMAAIVADSMAADGRPGKFVIGCQRPSPRSYWKIPLLARGESPVKAEDPDVAPMIHRVVVEKKTLVATHHSDCLRLADCVVVDVQCDYAFLNGGDPRTPPSSSLAGGVPSAAAALGCLGAPSPCSASSPLAPLLAA